MDHWTRRLVAQGFKWTSIDTGTEIVLQVKDSRWTATVSVLSESSERERTAFFAEDSFGASLEKCLLYLWQALEVIDRATFNVAEALGDLRRFAS
jgi:hypothetical protein